MGARSALSAIRYHTYPTYQSSVHPFPPSNSTYRALRPQPAQPTAATEITHKPNPRLCRRPSRDRIPSTPPCYNARPLQLSRASRSIPVERRRSRARLIVLRPVPNSIAPPLSPALPHPLPHNLVLHTHTHGCTAGAWLTVSLKNHDRRCKHPNPCARLIRYCR